MIERHCRGASRRFREATRGHDLARPQLRRGLVGEHDLALRVAHHADRPAVRGDPRPRRRAGRRSPRSGPSSSSRALIVGLFAGAWVDRLLRRPIMIWADLGRARPARLDPRRPPCSASWACRSCCSCRSERRSSRRSSTSPTTPTCRRSSRARSSSRRTARSRRRGSVAEFSAFGIGGFLIELFTAPIAIAIDAVTFLVSAVLLGTIRKKEPPPTPRADREPVLREIRDGIRIVARSPVLRALALSHGGTHILWGVFGTAYLLFAIERAGPGTGGDRRHRGRRRDRLARRLRALRRYMVRRFGIGHRSCSGWSAS